MRISLIVTALFLAVCNIAKESGRTSSRADVVAYAKQIDVATLDPRLKPQPLEKWMSSAELHLSRIQWGRGDCGLRPDDPPSKRDYPLCARIDFRNSAAWGWISLEIGTTRTGIHGQPELQHCVVKSVGPPPTGAFHEVKRLSDLRAALDAAAAEVRP